jgi:hypothetical protein
MAANTMRGRCVHCLRLSESITFDHGLPDSWYPDTTPERVQRYTAPSCPRCNRELGQLEKDLLIRIVLCIDPKKRGVSGLRSRVLRSVGLDTGELSETEKKHREGLRSKIRAELIPYAEVAGGPGAIPGLGPHEDAPWAVPIPWAGLSMIAEKIARVCEHKLEGRFVESPYGIRTSVSETGIVPSPLARFVKVFDFGPGFKICRLFPLEDLLMVRYWISIWDTLQLTAYIGLEDELRKLDQESARVEGLTPKENHTMRISPYLRTMS